MKTYSPQVRPHAQGNLCCQHTFTEAARPRGEGDPVGGKKEGKEIRRIIWCRGKNLLLDVLINKHCCLIPFHLLQPVHKAATQPADGFPSDLQEIHPPSFHPLISHLCSHPFTPSFVTRPVMGSPHHPFISSLLSVILFLRPLIPPFAPSPPHPFRFTGFYETREKAF